MSENDLPLFVKNQHHKEQIKILEESNRYFKEMSDSLKADVELAKQQADEAKRTAKFSNTISAISIIISICALIDVQSIIMALLSTL